MVWMIEQTLSFVCKQPNGTAVIPVIPSTNHSLTLVVGIFMYLYELTRYRGLAGL